VYADEPGLNSWWQGTSFSTPMVAGAAALLISQWPELGPGEITEAIREGAEPRPRMAARSPTTAWAPAHGSICSARTGTRRR